MVYFVDVRKTLHYIEFHEAEVPFHEVFNQISKCKNPRKKGEIFVIENDKYYIVYRITNNIAFVINAKRK